MTKMTRRLAAAQEAAEAGRFAASLLHSMANNAAGGFPTSADVFATLSLVWVRKAAHHAHEATR